MTDILERIKAKQERNKASMKAVAKATGQSVRELDAGCRKPDQRQRYGVWDEENGVWTGEFFDTDEEAAEAEEGCRRSGLPFVVRAVADDVDDSWLDDLHM
jgi:hypothetical protein